MELNARKKCVIPSQYQFRINAKEESKIKQQRGQLNSQCHGKEHAQEPVAHALY